MVYTSSPKICVRHGVHEFAKDVLEPKCTRDAEQGSMPTGKSCLAGRLGELPSGLTRLDWLAAAPGARLAKIIIDVSN